MNICVKTEFAIWNTATEYRHTKIGQSILKKSMSTYVAILDFAHVTLKTCIYGLKHDTLQNDSHKHVDSYKKNVPHRFLPIRSRVKVKVGQLCQN